MSLAQLTGEGTTKGFYGVVNLEMIANPQFLGTKLDTKVTINVELLRFEIGANDGSVFGRLTDSKDDNENISIFGGSK